MAMSTTYKILKQDHFVEIHLAGHVSPWDVLKIIHELYRQDPGKQIPDLWVLDENLDFSMHSFPSILKGLLKLAARMVKGGCRSAILSADEFQRVKLDMYCQEAVAILPYEVRNFTNRNRALSWLLD